MPPMPPTYQPPSPVDFVDRFPRLLIKVCGMREAENIREVEALGVDMMGFIFHPRSPRYVETVPGYLPTDCRRVGVFVNADIDYILRQVEAFGLGAVQLHGAESPEFCAALRERLTQRRGVDAPALSRPMQADPAPSKIFDASDTIIIKAVAAGSDITTYEGVTDLLLFDTPCAAHGGSGRRFDWTLLDEYSGSIPFMLSGGIGPDSVAEILNLQHPRLAGIDLNSRFERSPALKDAASLRDFIYSLRGSELFS